jgi:hypothetical protein
MKKVHASDDAPPRAPVLPEGVQAALGDLVGAAREGLLALSVGVGLGVMHELMAEEVQEVCGPKGKHDPERVAYRPAAMMERSLSVRGGWGAPAADAREGRHPDCSSSPPHHRAIPVASLIRNKRILRTAEGARL